MYRVFVTTIIFGEDGEIADRYVVQRGIYYERKQAEAEATKIHEAERGVYVEVVSGKYVLWNSVHNRTRRRA